MNADKLGDHTFKQLRKQDGVALYERIKNGRHYDYEVFVVKTVVAGAPLPNGKKVEESYEAYPGSASFGKTAWSVQNFDRAVQKFDELVAKMKSEVGQPKRRGRKSKVVASFELPKTKFTMRDLIAKTGLTQPVLYIRVQSLIKDGKIKEVGRVKSASGRGRATVVYKTVSQ